MSTALKGPLRIHYLSSEKSIKSSRIPPPTVSVASNSSFCQSNQPSVVTPRHEETSSIEDYSSLSSQNKLILSKESRIPNQDRQTTTDDAVQSSKSKINRVSSNGTRLNKFVRRLHDMLESEQNFGVVEWRRGLLVLHSTDTFAKKILPKYFNTKNFKTFRRQLNYYGFVHVRSFSTTGSTTTALWVNRDLAKNGTANVSSVLMLKRVEPCESAKTAEGRRVRKELAVSTVEDDIGVSAKSLQLEQIRSLAMRTDDGNLADDTSPPIPLLVNCPSISRLFETDNTLAANLLLMLSKSDTR